MFKYSLNSELKELNKGGAKVSADRRELPSSVVDCDGWVWCDEIGKDAQQWFQKFRDHFSRSVSSHCTDVIPKSSLEIRF